MKRKFQILAVEPNIKELPLRLQDKNVSLVCLNQALEEADVVVILVKHKEFVNIQNTVFQRKNILNFVANYDAK